jgi:hypothetical protein
MDVVGERTVLDVKTQDVPVLAISPLSVTSPKKPVDETKISLKNEDLSEILPATPSTSSTSYSSVSHQAVTYR